MLKKTSERGFAVIIAIVAAVIIAVAVIIVIASSGEDTTEPAATPVTGQSEQPPAEPITEPGPEQPAPPETPPQPGTLPADWDELSNTEKTTLNPHGCDHETQWVSAEDGSCIDTPQDFECHEDRFLGLDDTCRLYIVLSRDVSRDGLPDHNFDNVDMQIAVKGDWSEDRLEDLADQLVSETKEIEDLPLNLVIYQFKSSDDPADYEGDQWLYITPPSWYETI